MGKRAFMHGKAMCLGNGSRTSLAPVFILVLRLEILNCCLCYVVGYLGGFDGNFLWNRIGAGKS